MQLKYKCSLVFATASFLFLSCSTSSKSKVENIIDAQRRLIQPDSLAKKYRSGIDLTAKGNAPVAWTLEIDFDKLISFQAQDGKKFQVSPVFDKKEISDTKEMYVLRSAGRQMSITIYKKLCDSSASRKVEVFTDNITYSGCGAYLYDHRLHDTWILESVNKELQSAKDFKKGLPYIQLDLEKKLMSGSDGCEKIQSLMEVQGNRISFSTFPGTASGCGYRIEKIFSEMISGQLVSYYEENARLVLYLIDDSKLYFRRKSF